MTGSLLVNLSVVGQKPTGIATYAKNLVSELPELDTMLLSSQGGGSDRHHTHPIPNNLSAEYGKLGHLRRLLWTQFQLPTLYAQFRSSLLFSPVPEAPLGSTCRSVVMVHDLIPLRFPSRTSPLTYYARYYIPQVLAQAIHIICNSQATADDITHFFGVEPKKITPILLAHDHQHFRPINQQQPSSTRPYFIYLGRHDPYKNLQQLISAFAALSDRDCELWFAGPTDSRYTPILQQFADQLGVSQRLKFLDYVRYADLPMLLSQAIALVFPSLWEGFGFPALEAMACGTPVITSNLSALPEVVGDAAILINPYNQAELTNAMHAVLTDAAMRSQLHSAGLARASQFSWTKTAQATVQVLRQFL